MTAHYTPDDADVQGTEDDARCDRGVLHVGRCDCDAEPVCGFCFLPMDAAPTFRCLQPQLHTPLDAMAAADEVNARVKATLSEQRRALAVIGFDTDAHNNNPKWRAIAEKWNNR